MVGKKVVRMALSWVALKEIFLADERVVEKEFLKAEWMGKWTVIQKDVTEVATKVVLRVERTAAMRGYG